MLHATVFRQKRLTASLQSKSVDPNCFLNESKSRGYRSIAFAMACRGMLGKGTFGLPFAIWSKAAIKYILFYNLTLTSYASSARPWKKVYILRVIINDSRVMRAVEGVGILNIGLGLIALYLPVKFYSFASGLFTPEVAPPFSLGAVKVLTVFLFLPTVILIVNGIAMLSLGLKLEKVPEYMAFSEAGEYMGRLKDVNIEEGEVESFDLDEKGEETSHTKDDLLAVDDVMIVKEPQVEIGGVRHEFVNKEVYNGFGEYLGKVVEVTLDKDQEVISLLAMRGETEKVIKGDDIESSNGVIIVKYNA